MDPPEERSAKNAAALPLGAVLAQYKAAMNSAPPGPADPPVERQAEASTIRFLGFAVYLKVIVVSERSERMVGCPWRCHA